MLEFTMVGLVACFVLVVFIGALLGFRLALETFLESEWLLSAVFWIGSVGFVFLGASVALATWGLYGIV